MRSIVGLFFVLHGLVHLLYLGQSSRIFELRPGMAWPDGSWVFSRIFGDQKTRWVASFALVIAAVGFAAGGIGVLTGQAWYFSLVVGTAVFSSVIYLLLWDGNLKRLHDKGGIGVLINLGIIVRMFLQRWPDFAR